MSASEAPTAPAAEATPAPAPAPVETPVEAAPALSPSGKPIPKPIAFKDLPTKADIMASQKAARASVRGGLRGVRGAGGDLRIFNSPSAATAGLATSPEQMLKRSGRFKTSQAPQIPPDSPTTKILDEKAEARSKRFGTATPSTTTATATATATAASATPVKANAVAAVPVTPTHSAGSAATVAQSGVATLGSANDEERRKKRAEKFALPPDGKRRAAEAVPAAAVAPAVAAPETATAAAAAADVEAQ